MSENWITVTNCKIIDNGKITIPQETRQRYGFDKGWIVDMRVHKRYPDDDPISVDSARVHAKYRVSIGKSRLESNDLGDGDYVDVELRDTGNRF